MKKDINKYLDSHEPVYICSHVFDNTRPILLASKVDGDWQFLCGGEHDNDELPKVVGLGHIIKRDCTIMEIIDLPDDWEAERGSTSESWVRYELEEE